MDKTNCPPKRGRKFTGEKVKYPKNIELKELLEEADQTKAAKQMGITVFHLNKILNGHKPMQAYQRNVLEQFGELNRMKTSIGRAEPLFEQQSHHL